MKDIKKNAFNIVLALNKYKLSEETLKELDTMLIRCNEIIEAETTKEQEEITMIELLEMIANDSILPKKVIYGDTTYLLDAEDKEYYEEDNKNNLLFDFDGVYKLDEQLKQVLRIEREEGKIWEQ